MSPRAAREHVRVARRLAALPAVHAAFASGELSYSKVRAVTRMATPATEAELVEFARHATAAQVARVAHAVGRDQRALADDGPDVVHAAWTEAGRLELRGSFAAETGAVVLGRLDAAAEVLARAELNPGAACGKSGPAGPPVGDGPAEGSSPSSVTRQDGASAAPTCGKSGPAGPRPALSSKANRRARGLLGALTGERGGGDGEEFLVVVHADWATIAGGAGSAVVEGGPALDGAVFRRLCCDQPMALLVRDADGNPLFMGRTTRQISRRMRRALRVRDGDRCAHPGCDTRDGVQAHHVIWWRDGGRTDITNLVLLCRRHHRAVHDGDLRVVGDGTGRFRFLIGGRDLSAAPEVPLTLDDLHAELEAAAAPWSGTGEALDLDHAVTAIHSLHGTLWN